MGTALVRSSTRAEGGPPLRTRWELGFGSRRPRHRSGKDHADERPRIRAAIDDEEGGQALVGTLAEEGDRVEPDHAARPAGFPVTPGVPGPPAAVGLQRDGVGPEAREAIARAPHPTDFDVPGEAGVVRVPPVGHAPAIL